MLDGQGRTIDYMRISITDRCNLRCRYCMPNGISWVPMEQILTYEEIKALAIEAAELGIRKIKVTGGEPLVRKGCPSLVGMLKSVPGVEQVTLTTNGVYLEEYVEELKDHGLDAVNVSLDTLNPQHFYDITGRDDLKKVLDGIEAALREKIPLKVNVVLQKGQNEDEWMDLASLAKERKLDVRFIEMMPIGYGRNYELIPNEEILRKLEVCYGPLKKDMQVHGNGPAVYYQVPGYEGSIGFISAMHGKFCQYCNRIRVTSTGEIKSCLCYEDRISVRDALRANDTEEVRRRLALAIQNKPAAHKFEIQELITEQKEMSSIGG